LTEIIFNDKNKALQKEEKMHLGKIKNWLFHSDPKSDMRPISWIIGILLLTVVIAVTFFGPILYLEYYNPHPDQLTMAIIAAVSMISLVAIFVQGHIVLVSIDFFFDICRLIRRG